MDVVFWQNIASHIQAPALRVLCRLWPGRVHGVWCSGLDAERRALGWQTPCIEGMEEHVLPDKNAADAARDLMRNFGGGIHIMSGLHAYAPIIAAYRAAVRLGVTDLGLMVEPGVQMGWKGLMRPWRARWLARNYIPHIKAVLAMGQHGVEFYRRAGFSDEVLFPYLYQCESYPARSPEPVHDPVRLVYVGKFIPRKGVDVMIRALGKCRRGNWRLSVIGDGTESWQMQDLAQRVGVASHIAWLGAKPSSAIISLLSQHDICLIPSRYEGWGVVSNEAIQAGLAVVCSSQVTSRELVDASGAGTIFRSEDPVDMAISIDSFLTNPDMISEAKNKACAYRARIGQAVIGEYLKDVLAYVFLGDGDIRPRAPWLDTVKESPERFDGGSI